MFPAAKSKYHLESPRNSDTTLFNSLGPVPQARNPSRLHPPRLQHSPSLPNLWSPKRIERLSALHNMSNGPPTEPLPSSHHSGSAAGPESPAATPTQFFRPAIVTTHPPHVQRCIKKNRPHLLLTPPLTPSSSVRTGSIDSRVSGDTEDDISETHESRFLLIRNVPRDASSDALKSALFQSFTAPEIDSTTTIKGMYVRHQATHGVVILAFYDYRDAVRAQGVLLHGDQLSEIMSAVGEDGSSMLTCQFVSVHELIKLIGKSTFVNDTDGWVHASIDQAGSDNLKDMIKSFGSVRSLEERVELCEGSDQTIFHVEYYDIRDAQNARDALDGQFISGLTVTMLDGAPQDLSTAATNIQEGPWNETFGRAGERSEIRNNFFGDAGRVRPRSVSAGNHQKPRPLLLAASQNDAVPVLPATALLPAQATLQLHDAYGRRASNHLFFDATSKSQSQSNSQDSAHGHVHNSAEEIDHNSADGEIKSGDICQAPTCPSTSYVPQHNAYSTSCSFPQQSTLDESALQVGSCVYNTPLPPASPTYHHPVVHATISPGNPFPGYVSYDYDRGQGIISNPSSGKSTTNWAFEHAMRMAAASAIANFPLPSITPPVCSHIGPEYYFPSPQSVHAPTGAYYHHFPHPITQQFYPTLVTHELYAPSTPQVNNVSSGPSHIAAIPDNSTLIVHERNSYGPKDRLTVSTPARNQLNIAHIESGMDPRTTVMIKNIPNKMSDQHLLGFIEKVCPRRIDFLYLRMDFKNECNVGYAFVNFISVEDLLTFARAKLGEKWNMFSSEKVLQMSYGNYQGKEALVDKFKNSPIMDEREAWRPKIFYSDGPNQGLPEQFPAPTHFKRKERVSRDRTVLFSSSGHDSDQQEDGKMLLRKPASYSARR